MIVSVSQLLLERSRSSVVLRFLLYKNTVFIIHLLTINVIIYRLEQRKIYHMSKQMYQNILYFFIIFYNFTKITLDDYIESLY